MPRGTRTQSIVVVQRAQATVRTVGNHKHERGGADFCKMGISNWPVQEVQGLKRRWLILENLQQQLRLGGIHHEVLLLFLGISAPHVFAQMSKTSKLLEYRMYNR